jgi:hypothetical protein
MNTSSNIIKGLQSSYVAARVENLAKHADPDHKNISYGAVKNGQRSACTATLAPDQGAGSSASYDFPFFKTSFGGHRGHLIARTYGGSGSDPRNLVPLGATANLRMYSIFEGEIKKHLVAAAASKKSCSVSVSVTPYYSTDDTTKVESVIPTCVKVLARCDNCNTVLVSGGDGFVDNSKELHA